MVLEEQEKGLSDDEDYMKLPGSKKIDVIFILLRLVKLERNCKLMSLKFLSLIVNLLVFAHLLECLSIRQTSEISLFLILMIWIPH